MLSHQFEDCELYADLDLGIHILGLDPPDI